MPLFKADQTNASDRVTVAEAEAAYAPKDFFAGTTAPSSPEKGWTWYDTTNKLLKTYDENVADWVLAQAVTSVASKTGDVSLVPTDAGLSTLSQSGGVTITSGKVRIGGDEIGFGPNFNTKITYNSIDERLEFFVDGTISANLAMYVNNEGTIYVDNNPLGTGTDLYGGVFDEYDDPIIIKDLIYTSNMIGNYETRKQLSIAEYQTRMEKFRKMSLIGTDPGDTRLNLQNFLKLLGGGIYQLSSQVKELKYELNELKKQTKT